MLTADEQVQYKKDGFIVIKGLIGDAWIARIREDLVGIHERMAMHSPQHVHVSWEDLDDPDGPARIQQVMHSEQVSPALRRVLRSPQVLDVVEQLLGPEISLFHSKLLPKAARAGTAIPWHQDYAYWRTETNEPLMVNCQIAIDEAVLENGCIQFVPGSHTRGLVDHETKGGTFGIFITEPDEQRDDAVAVEMAPGDVVFFSCLVAHGSDENRSDRDRCMNTFVYNAPGNDPDTCREVLRGQ